MPSPRTRLGRLGEELACQFLKEKGYAILATNYRCPWGEVDIVARDGEDLVFVEVRTRRSAGYGAPEESLTPAKVRRLLATAQDYLQNHADAEASWRIDLVCIRGGRHLPSPLINHLRHAVQE
jgi:putative endonuclease